MIIDNRPSLSNKKRPKRCIYLDSKNQCRIDANNTRTENRKLVADCMTDYIICPDHSLAHLDAYHKLKSSFSLERIQDFEESEFFDLFYAIEHNLNCHFDPVVFTHEIRHNMRFNRYLFFHLDLLPFFGNDNPSRHVSKLYGFQKRKDLGHLLMRFMNRAIIILYPHSSSWRVYFNINGEIRRIKNIHRFYFDFRSFLKNR